MSVVEAGIQPVQASLAVSGRVRDRGRIGIEIRRAVIDGAVAQFRGDPAVAFEVRGGGRYYYRAVRREGRTIKEYVGKGPAAELAARLDARTRRERDRAAAALRAEESRCEPAERAADEFEGICQLMVAAAMHAAGYHRHRSGPWRRRRDGRAANLG
jgi:hypothetical protein